VAPLSLRRAARALGSASLLALAACHPTEAFESTVQVVRNDPVANAENGDISLVDLELEWDPCPGDQYQVIRGGHDFAACAAKYPRGTYVPVKVVHFWDPRGYYRWDISRFGDCDRPIEPDAEGSYEKSQECVPVEAYGHPVGFSCSRRPFRQLLATCPWMGR
jgi:hypothetical protein